MVNVRTERGGDMGRRRREVGRILCLALAAALGFGTPAQAETGGVSGDLTRQTEEGAADRLPALTEKQLYRIMSEKFMQRKKEFSVPCQRTKAVSSVVNRINSGVDARFYSVFFDMAEAVDDTGTTDDSDYLYGNIREVNCYYADGQLHFYGVLYFETKKQTRAVNRRIKKVAARIKRKGKNRLQRIAYAYEYVVSRVYYDDRRNCNYSAYAGLYKRKTVCNGYALMMYKILMKMNIPCRFVTGSVKEGKKWYLHAWNMVQLRGKWYNLDACFDDADDGNVYGDYFLKTDRAYRKDHRKDFFYRAKSYRKAHPMAAKNYKY